MRFRNEQAFTDAVIDLAKMYGWLVYHVRGNTRRLIQGHAGFPDLVLVKGRVLFRELKMTPKSPFQPGQNTWLAGLHGAGAKIWYPSDWEEIVATLAGKGKPW